MLNQTHRAPPRYKIPGFFSILLSLLVFSHLGTGLQTRASSKINLYTNCSTAMLESDPTAMPSTTAVSRRHRANRNRRRRAHRVILPATYATRLGHAPWALRNRCAARLWWDGRSLSRDRQTAGTHRRDQDPAKRHVCEPGKKATGSTTSIDLTLSFRHSSTGKLAVETRVATTPR